MKDLLTLARFAIRLPGIPPNAATYGWFDIPSPTTGATLRVGASASHGWDHVSVSTKKRCPNWPEMSRIKTLFFEPDEWAMQVHVPEVEHLNTHPNCLHLWRPHVIAIPQPPSEMVSLPGLTLEQVRRMSPAERRSVQLQAQAQMEARGVRP